MKYGLSEKQLNELLAIVTSQPEVEQLVLFGSRALGTYKEASDIDLAIKGSKVTDKTISRLKDAFEDSDLPFFVDVVDYQAIDKPKFKAHIDGKGVGLIGRGDSGWRKTTLGEIAKFLNGRAYKQKEFLSSGTPIVRIQNLTGKGNVVYSDLELPDDKYISKGDLIYAWSATFGPYIWSGEKSIFHYHIWKIICDEDQVEKLFLYYYLLAASERLKDEGNGTLFIHITKGLMESFEINLPSVTEQKAIASVLSSLDDKIDLLHRQNKTLEAMAETLFRQWFVEEAEQGWEQVALEDVTSRITDGAHASPATVEFGMPMASVKDMFQWGINTDKCRKISKDDYAELVRTDCRPLKNDILIAKDGSYLKHVFVAEEDMDVVILSSIAILRPNGKYHPLLLAIFLKMRSTIEAMENIVTGAVIPRIVLKDFRKFQLPLPPISFQEEALTQIEPIYAKCWENIRQVDALENLRDTLLPKLMSGAVRVKTESNQPPDQE